MHCKKMIGNWRKSIADLINGLYKPILVFFHHPVSEKNKRKAKKARHVTRRSRKINRRGKHG